MTLDELQRICDAATPGPWVSDQDHSDPTVWYSSINSGVSVADAGTVRDADFIATAREWMPGLVAVAKAARCCSELGMIQPEFEDNTTQFAHGDLVEAIAALETSKCRPTSRRPWKRQSPRSLQASAH